MTGKRFCASPETASPGIFYQDGCLHYHDWDHAGPAGASSRNQEQRMETTKRRLLLALAGKAGARPRRGAGPGRQGGGGVVVENRPGANGIIALQAVKHAPADGYTLLLASNSPLAVNPLVIKDLGYDPVKDYKPLSGLARSMNAIVVANDSPLATLEALLAAAKAGPLTVGTYSAGYHL